MRTERTRSGRRMAATAALTAAVAMAAVSVLAPSLRANGGTLRVADHPIGEYRVWVYTAPTPPRPDSVDVSVLTLLGGKAVGSAEVEIVVRGQPLERTTTDDPPADARTGAPSADAASPSLRAAATREAADDPRYHAAKVRPGSSGPWRFTVHLTGPRGEGSVGFEIDLREPGLLDRPWVVLVLALLPVAALAAWLLRP